MKINEIFESIEGEGKYSGIPTIFIRTQGCGIKCLWCDSKNTWDINKGKEIKVDDILEFCNCKIRRVSITGGDPMLQDLEELNSLVIGLHELGKIVNLEHSGKVDPNLNLIKTFDQICIDIKPPSSGVEATESDIRYINEILSVSVEPQLKCVVKDIVDLEFYSNIFKDQKNIKFRYTYSTFSPMFDDNMTISNIGDKLISYSNKYSFGYSSRIGIQIHKILGLR